MATIQRQGKLRENRTIYISWLVGDETSHSWVEAFWTKIRLHTPPVPPKLRRTDEALGGDHTNRSTDDILADVTDIVAVLTGDYLKINKEGRRPTDREFARFIELMKDDLLDSGSRRAWVAPLQKFRYDWVVLGDATLADRKSWVLKDPRFAVPPNDDEIFDAVMTLLDPDDMENG